MCPRKRGGAPHGRFRAAVPPTEPSSGRFVRTAADAAALLAPLLEHRTGEGLSVLYLAGDRVLLGTGFYEGGPDETQLPLRAIAAAALGLGAEALVIGHNHPSGDPAPSAADIAATRALAQTLRSLGIRLDDHLVFAGGNVASFRELGLL